MSPPALSAAGGFARGGENAEEDRIFIAALSAAMKNHSAIETGVLKEHSRQ